MPTLTTIATGPGVPRLDAIVEWVRERQSDDRLVPLTIVTGTHAHTHELRLELAARLGGIAAVGVVSIQQLAERIAAPSIQGVDGRALLVPPILHAAIQAELAQDAGFFAPASQHPGTARAIAAAYPSLRRLSDEHLDRLAERGSRARELVRIVRATHNRINREWHDGVDALQCAVDRAVDADIAVYGEMLVCVDVPLRPLELALIDALADQVEVTKLDATNIAPHPPLPGTRAVSVLSASDPDDEVRAAVRVVMQAIHDGTRPDRIALVLASSEPYARIVAEQLDSVGVMFRGSSGRHVLETAPARFVLRFLALNHKHVTRTDLSRLLTCAPLDLPDGASVRSWQRIAREAYCNGSLADWQHQLTTFAEGHERRAADPNEHGDANDLDQVERIREALARDATRARTLVGFLKDLEATLVRLLSATTWTELVSILRDALERVKLSRVSKSDRAARRLVIECLEQLRHLDAYGAPADAIMLAELLRMDLGVLALPATSVVGVRVLHIEHALGLEADVVLVLGATEGQIPRRPSIDPLLPEHDRMALREDGADIDVATDVVVRQQRAFHAATSAARMSLTITMSRGDLRRTTEHVPSRWLLEAAAKASGRDSIRPSELPDLEFVREITSFGAGLRGADAPATLQELRVLIAIARGARDAGDALLARSAQLVLARRSRDFTRFDGNLGAEGVDIEIPSPVDTTVSATRLEGYVACPHAYFLANVLGVALPEMDELDDTISALDFGSLAHEVLDRFLRERGLQQGTDPWSDEDRAALGAILDEVCAQYERDGRTGHPLSWHAKRAELDALLDAFLEHDNVFRAGRSLGPVATELSFGMPDSDTPAASIALPDGRELRFRGSIDRVDLTTDGTELVITDYKTGSPRPYSDITQDDPFARNKRLQLPVYAHAIRTTAANVDSIPNGAAVNDISAGYWFIARDPAPDKRREVTANAEIDSDLSTLLGQMVDLIESGVFPQHPADYCDYCGKSDAAKNAVSRDWNRIADAASLADFRALVDGTGDSQEDHQ